MVRQTTIAKPIVDYQRRYPYPETKEQLAPPGVSICKRCKAINHNKHWYVPGEESQSIASHPQKEEILCPGCLRVNQKLWDKEVILGNSNLNEIKETVHGMLSHIEDKCW